jgi:hypothetical protein
MFVATGFGGDGDKREWGEVNFRVVNDRPDFCSEVRTTAKR